VSAALKTVIILLAVQDYIQHTSQPVYMYVRTTYMIQHTSQPMYMYVTVA